MKCCVVEPHFIAFVIVTFEGEGPKKVYLVGRRPCPDEATQIHIEPVVLKTSTGFVTNELVFNTCEKHAKK